MSVFSEAYQIGLNAAQTAAENIKEIDAVFNDLSAEVSASSGHKIIITRGKKSKREPLASNRFLSIDMPVPYKAIIAKNTETDKEIPIAEYEIDKKGYPITIAWADREENCWSKDDLTETLKDVLADPTTGRAFIQLLSQ